MDKIEKYTPSNGSEGEWFTEKYCMRCRNCDPDPGGKKQCEILLRTLIYSVNEPEYPDSWRYVDGKPACVEWKEWDWMDKGNPDDPQNENYVMPHDPNQIKLDI